MDATGTPAAWPKQCSCCCRPLYRYDWELLPLLAKKGAPPRADLEMRNCFCGTTLAVELDARLISAAPEAK